MDDRTLQIVLKARDEASSVLKKFSGQVEDTGDTVQKGLGNKLMDVFGSGGAFYTMTNVIRDSVGAFSQSQNVTAQLNAVIESTGGKAGMTADAILSLSSALEQKSKFEDEAITSAQNLLLTFTSIGKDVFPNATQTVLDMSQALGQDLKSSAIQLGKALNDPIEGVTALRRVGVSFNESQLAQIESMQKSGDLMGAQKLILQELAVEFGGSALEASKTFDGQMTILNNNIGNLKETIGQGMVEALSSFGGGLDGVNSKVVTLNQYLGEHKDLVNGIVFVLGGLTLAFGALLVVALGALAGITVATGALVAFIIGSFSFALGVIAYHWQGIQFMFSQGVAEMTQIWAFFMANFQYLFSVVVVFFSNKINEIKKAWSDGLDAIRRMVDGAISYIKGVIDNFIPKIRIGIELPDIEGAFNSLKGRAKSIGIPGFASGGYVGSTGLALVHAGEYVLSRDMLAGRQAIEAPVNTYSSPITVNAVINNDVDIDRLGYTLSWYIQNSR